MTRVYLFTISIEIAFHHNKYYIRVPKSAAAKVFKILWFTIICQRGIDYINRKQNYYIPS